MLQPCLPQHRAFQIGNSGYAVAQVVYHGFHVALVQTCFHRFCTADRECFARALAGMGQELVQPRVLRRCRRHHQIVRRQPVRELAELGAVIQADMGLVHHQPDLQAAHARQCHEFVQRGAFIVAIRGIAGLAVLGAGHGLRRGQQHRARNGLLVAAARQHDRRQARCVGQQRILGLLGQVDEGHEPEPDRRLRRRDLGKHARQHEGLAGAGGRAQQAGRRGLAKQGIRHVADDAALELHRHQPG